MRQRCWREAQFVTMSLIPSLNTIAAIPLMVVLGPIVFSAFSNIMEHPLAHSIAVLLNNTAMVWKPFAGAALVAIRKIVPILKALFLTVSNVLLSVIQTVQGMGVSLSAAFPSLIVRLGEVGEALVVLTRSLGNVLYYGLRALSFIVGSVEKVFVFGKQLLFEAHLVTLDDVYNVMISFAVVLSTMAVLYWLRKTPQPTPEPKAEAFQPRRSSRLARKRAMLYASDMSDALSPCKKSSATATYL